MLSNLNKQQHEAVITTEGPVMVFAGAGSGKTRTLTYRVAYMIDKGKIEPGKILAITFTNKATNEMRDRLINLIGPLSYDVTISTFHSLCARILRREISVLGYTSSFSIIDEDEQLKIINETIKKENLDRKQFSGKKTQKILNYHKCFNSKPSDPLEKRIFSAYEKRMKELNLLDFEDLLLKVKDIFSNYPSILEKYARKFHYVLVDEFQDTNLIQYEIVCMLTKESRNLFVVGDDDQSIYSFRGTNYENMQLFKRDFPEHKLFLLTENYRSTQVILEGCNRIIANNENREKKELFSKIKGETNDVKIYQAYNEKLEVDYILNEIFSLKLKGTDYSSFAILYRNSVLMRNLEIGLIQMGLPYQVYGGISYLRRREIKDVIAYFKLILDHNDIYSFRRIVNVPSRLLGEQTIGKVLDIKEKYKLGIFDAIDACKTLLTEKRYQTLVDFKDLIISLRKSIDSDNLIDVYEALLEKTEYREYIKQEDNAEERMENLEEFKSILRQIEEDGRDLTRTQKLQEAFDEAILADDKLQNQKQNRDGITLSTIHSAKGLEFDYVFVIGLEENVFPNVYRFTTDNEIEEERRIAYVAYTRAKKRLYLLSAENRLLYGERYNNRTSRFIFEFTGSFPDLEENFNQDEGFEYSVQKALSDKPRADFAVSDKVYHNFFGPGMIIAIDKHPEDSDKDTAQIFFDREKKLKTIMLSHPGLSKN
ncbi:MAG: exodeoxyribonuclease V subunit gamma [Bacilli bacterium]|nr:exodeoxyribonuclease V subunit gamma [Bacilli bacterium]